MSKLNKTDFLQEIFLSEMLHSQLLIFENKRMMLQSKVHINLVWILGIINAANMDFKVGDLQCIIYQFFLIKIPDLSRAKQMHLILICCSPPRKSLVKGERFIRFEEEQEWTDLTTEITLLFLIDFKIWSRLRFFKSFKFIKEYFIFLNWIKFYFN